MNNPSQNKREIEKVKYGKSFGATEGAEINEGTSTSIKDQDTTLSMIVLLIACLALAALAHIVV